MTSTSKKTLIEKLLDIQKGVEYLQKESKGTQYDYTGSSQVIASIRDKMNELGVLLLVCVTDHNLLTKDEPNKTGGTRTTYFTELNLEMKWINADDPTDTLAVPFYGQGVDIAGEKGVGKALTYAEKYFILKTFHIPTDNDDPDAFQEKYNKPNYVSSKVINELNKVLSDASNEVESMFKGNGSKFRKLLIKNSGMSAEMTQEQVDAAKQMIGKRLQDSKAKFAKEQETKRDVNAEIEAAAASLNSNAAASMDDIKPFDEG